MFFGLLYSPIKATFYFKRPFYVFFDIFISTSRMTLNVLPIHSLMFEDCFRYLQSLLKIIFYHSGVMWNENFFLKWKKTHILKRLERSKFFLFFGDFHFKRLQNGTKLFSTNFEGTKNTLRTSRNVSVKNLESYDS